MAPSKLVDGIVGGAPCVNPTYAVEVLPGPSDGARARRRCHRHAQRRRAKHRVRRDQRDRCAADKERVVDPHDRAERTEHELTKGHEAHEHHRVDAHHAAAEMIGRARLHERVRHAEEEHDGEARARDKDHRAEERSLEREQQQQQPMGERSADQQEAATLRSAE